MYTSESHCVIPARGGSKRIPGKNIRQFYGKPVIAYAIETARRSLRFQRIVVSTDDQRTADISEQWGAEVHWRNPAAATDKACDYQVIMEYLRNNTCDYLCYLYPVTPLLEPWHLTMGWNQVTQIPNVWHVRDPRGKDAGQFYWMPTERVMGMTAEQYNTRWSHIDLGWFEAWDVNTEEDWHVLEALYAYKWHTRGVERI